MEKSPQYQEIIVRYIRETVYPDNELWRQVHDQVTRNFRNNSVSL